MEGPRTTWSVRTDQELLWLLLSWVTVFFQPLCWVQYDLKFLKLEVSSFTKMGRTVLVLYHLDGCLSQWTLQLCRMCGNHTSCHSAQRSVASVSVSFSFVFPCGLCSRVDITVMNLKSCWLTYFLAYWLIKQMCLVGPRDRHIHSSQNGSVWASIHVLMGWQCPDRNVHRAVWCHAGVRFSPQRSCIADHG